MRTGSLLLDASAAILSSLVALVGAGLGLDGMGALFSSYTRACMRLDDERQLLDNCREPVFFRMMSAYPMVCSDVEANARVGALWIALREVTDAFRVVWKPWLSMGVLAACLLLPVCWVCLARMSVRVSRYRRGHLIPRYSGGCKEM